MNHPSPNDSLAADPITVEVMGMCPQIRDDLRITRHIDSGQISFLIEDPTSGRFSRLGVAEYTFVSLLDGRTTVAECLSATASKHGLDALDESDAISLVGWLVESGLAHTVTSQSGSRVAQSQQKDREQQIASAANPMFQKIPLGNPSRFVNPIAGLLKRGLANQWLMLIGVVVGVVWFAITCLAVVENFNSFWAASRNVLASGNWMWLVATWLIVKSVHELGHAVACRWLGGRVGEAGVMMVLFMPLPYVEVSSSWAFPNKWHRILVAAAGMIVEAVLASVGIWVWMHSTDPLVQMHARNLIVTATFTTVLFNLNPLMRFDGYYMLSDYLEMPNLSTNATRWLSYVRQKYLFGANVTRPTWPEGRVGLVAAYAVAAFVWRILICVSLAMAATGLFWGAGILLAIVAIGFWTGKPLARFLSNWNDPMRINRWYFKRICLGLSVVLIGVLVIPYQRRVMAPMVVTLDQPTEIRASVRGFVREISVVPGQAVDVGDVLCRLENKELEIDLQRLGTEISQSRHRQRVLRRERALVELEIERANELAMQTRRGELQNRIDGLLVQSQVSGTVMQSDLVDQLGTLVTAGKRLFVIADPDRIKLVAMIGQDDAVTLRTRDQFSADVWIGGQGRVIDEICFDHLKPRATRDLAHPAMASALGGPLSVYSNPQAKNVNEQWKLVQPRVVAEARFGSDQAADQLLGGIELRSGQTGTVRFSLGRRMVGQILVDDVMQWYRNASPIAAMASR
ncbi:Peptidase family M50 [Rubripirellula obstinata]|uniref:Peptidase family M50 n=1 Tax=Rubripirellula obstinata TaxID=406547 RepID=A0A5B1CF26_9BACT|nr:HlyD family efflux transporter periplasmic adaptor subunit [Rubripirellula obstinata]KAA1257934.1 Peptidase family M50 [Rubripirellula obstinata]